MTKIAIIGTAGRDKTKRMDLALWHWMVSSAMANLPPGAHVVSGGAAWADHLAVALFLSGYVSRLTLHLPTPFRNGWYRGPSKSSSSAANWYHKQFAEATGVDSLRQIETALATLGCNHTCEPSVEGFGGMFARNAKVAMADELIAFTFGTGDVPADGGTKHTWDLCKGKRLHIPLPHSISGDDL